jgi:TatA/E family protein of Tat protein translocase
VLNLDPSKLLVVAVVAVIVLGPDKLPEFARQVGATWRSFLVFRQRMESEVRNSVPDLPSTTELARYARSPVALLDRLSSVASVEDDVANSLAAKGDLPPIAGSADAHWTERSLGDPIATGDARSDADVVRLEAPAPHVGDATLN